jgi:hypothetical protein
MYLVAVSVLLTFIPFTKAIPALALSPIDTNPLGQPFINAVLPLQPGFSPRFDLFRRQGCPNNSLLCPSGKCCSYDTSCCGSSCCPSGYLCTGGTQAAPCCVAITATSNQCGGSNGNVRITIPFAISFCILDSMLTVRRIISLAHDKAIFRAMESTSAAPPIMPVTTTLVTYLGALPCHNPLYLQSRLPSRLPLQLHISRRLLRRGRRR